MAEAYILGDLFKMKVGSQIPPCLLMKVYSGRLVMSVWAWSVLFLDGEGNMDTWDVFAGQTACMDLGVLQWPRRQLCVNNNK